MLHWNAAIYMDDTVKKRPYRYRKMIEQNKLTKSCYCITLPVNRENCLELYSSREFWFQYYRKQEIEIVGLAADKESAKQLLCRITEDVVQKYGNVSPSCIREFFSVQKTS